MEKELGREFGVFPLEPCPRRGAARAGPPDTAAEWPLPTAASLLLPGFISGIFSHSPSEEHFLPAFPREEQDGSGERWDSNGARSLLGRLEIRAPTPATKPGAAANL